MSLKSVLEARMSFALEVESTSIGSSSSANVEFRLLGCVLTTGELSSHCLSSLFTKVTVSFKHVSVGSCISSGLDVIVSKVSFRFEGFVIVSLGVGGIESVSL